MNTIIERLNELFAPMDAKVLEQTKQWGAERVAALNEFKSSAEAKEPKFQNVWNYYARLYDIAGGKGWFKVFSENGVNGRNEYITKHCAKVVEKRNASIAAKLTKAGVSSVISEEFTHTVDGFNGVFVVNTDAGIKRVMIDTIYAGGWNVQCLHLRVLVKIK